MSVYAKQKALKRGLDVGVMQLILPKILELQSTPLNITPSTVCLSLYFEKFITNLLAHSIDVSKPISELKTRRPTLKLQACPCIRTTNRNQAVHKREGKFKKGGFIN